MDSDSPWEENPQGERAPEADWTKLATEFTNSGYREGIIAGKEAFLQAGFDAGFADVGVPIGRELGNLRGAVSAIASLLNAQTPGPLELEELRSISSVLSTIRFSDLAPRDLEAERHAREQYLGVDGPAVADHDAETAPREKRPAMEDIARLKERLASLATKLGLAFLA